MKKKSQSGFEKGKEICLPCGAVITPIYRNRNTKVTVNHTALGEYLISVRNMKCEFKNDCLKALKNQDYCLGFSCEECPLNQAKKSFD